MDVLDVLLPLAGGVFAGSQVAIHDGDVGGVNLQKEGNGSLISEIVLEASFDFLPLVHVDPVVESATDEDQSGNADHVVATQVDICLIAVGCHLVQVGFNHLPPVLHDLVVAADQHVKGVQLHHFLQTDHQNIGFVDWNIEQFFLVLLGEFLRVNSIAVPGEDEQHSFLVRAILDFLQHILGDIIIEILRPG